MKKFQGKVALVTGGSKGIGLAVVKALVSNGAKVLTCARSKETWNTAIRDDNTLKVVDFASVDLSKEEALIGFFEYIGKKYRRIDMAVNSNAPPLPAASFGELHTCPLPALHDAFKFNFWVPLLCLYKEIPLMPNGGSIVNVSSATGLRPTPHAALYGAGKSGFAHLTKSTALEYISKGIRINGIAPGYTLTPSIQAYFNSHPNPDEIKKEMADKIPLKRLAEPDEIASPILFLLSEESCYLVGHTLVVDGGVMA